MDSKSLKVQTVCLLESIWCSLVLGILIGCLGVQRVTLSINLNPIFLFFQVMENAMSSATTTTTPENQIEALMKQVADENGLEITENLKLYHMGE